MRKTMGFRHIVVFYLTKYPPPPPPPPKVQSPMFAQSHWSVTKTLEVPFNQDHLITIDIFLVSSQIVARALDKLIA